MLHYILPFVFLSVSCHRNYAESLKLKDKEIEELPENKQLSEYEALAEQNKILGAKQRRIETTAPIVVDKGDRLSDSEASAIEISDDEAFYCTNIQRADFSLWNQRGHRLLLRPQNRFLRNLKIPYLPWIRQFAVNLKIMVDPNSQSEKR